VAAAIVWGLRLERRRLRKSLGIKVGIAKGEAMLVQRIEDLDDLLAPVEERFGEIKREQVANALLLSARLAMKQEQLRRTKDSELRAELAPQVTELKRELKQARDDVGIYIMSYVRSIVPKTTWSIWARLKQVMAKMEAGSTNLWSAREQKLLQHNATGGSLYTHIQLQRLPDPRRRAFIVSEETSFLAVRHGRPGNVPLRHNMHGPRGTPKGRGDTSCQRRSQSQSQGRMKHENR
jgi:hypothetical protein